MRITPIAGALGADIEGVDLSEGAPDADFAAIRSALNRYGVIAIRDQDLTPASQLAFARRFGEIHYHPHVQGLPEQPEVMEILKTETDTANFGAGWHSDQMFASTPANYTCLYGIEIPEAGGDTLFACMRGGFDALSPAMQHLACSLRSRNLSVASQLARRSTSAVAMFANMRAKDAPEDEEMAEHPIVRRHPETGEASLYVGIHTTELSGFAEAESRPLIDYWLACLTRPENTCRLRWRPGTLAIWDNRLVLHNAINDYQGKRRRMHRVTTVGEAPLAYAAS